MRDPERRARIVEAIRRPLPYLGDRVKLVSAIMKPLPNLDPTRKVSPLARAIMKPLPNLTMKMDTGKEIECTNKRPVRPNPKAWWLWEPMPYPDLGWYSPN